MPKKKLSTVKNYGRKTTPTVVKQVESIKMESVLFLFRYLFIHLNFVSDILFYVVLMRNSISLNMSLVIEYVFGVINEIDENKNKVKQNIQNSKF